MKATDILIAVDDGHGMETAGKRTPVFPKGSKYEGLFMHENEFNNAVASILLDELKRLGFKAFPVAPTDEDTPLSTRVALANNTIPNGFGRHADLYISIHANAIKGSWGDWGGIETYAYLQNPKSKRIAENIHKWILKGTQLRDRGLKDGGWLYIVKNTVPGVVTVLVEAGFMDNLKEAELLMSKEYRRETALEIAQGICESYGVPYIPEQAHSVEIDKHHIEGESAVFAEQMVSYVKNYWAKTGKENKESEKDLLEIATLFLEVGKKYGIRGDVAFAQALHETHYFLFDLGTAVTPDQHNYCGMGVVKKGLKGNSFLTIKDGVTAQIQHLYAYATKKDLPVGEKLLDPRYIYVTRGIAPNWEDLAGKWAYPGFNRDKYKSLEEALIAKETYGQKIISIYEEMLKAKIEKPAEEIKNQKEDSNNKKDWKEEGFQYLLDEYGIDKNYWKPTSPIDMGTLGILLKRRDEKK